uniref:Ig-like domain-containing protein n=1 Tax=Poecilia mexicana TaxID=48701 RepID=A0A3B3Y7R5_9TELE
MTNCNMTLVLFLAFSWISASVCQFDTVVVQPGKEVTLQCSNFSSVFSRVWWFKLTKGPNVSCISSMQSFGTNVSWYDGFQQEKFTMTSNFSNVFLNIKKLDVKDSGIYFCGYKIRGVPGVFTATDLQTIINMSCGHINSCGCFQLKPMQRMLNVMRYLI